LSLTQTPQSALRLSERQGPRRKDKPYIFTGPPDKNGSALATEDPANLHGN